MHSQTMVGTYPLIFVFFLLLFLVLLSMDMRAAETALQTLNGRKIFDTEIKVNWAYQGQQNKEVNPVDTICPYHLIVF